MSILEFVASLIDSLAWPVSIFAIILLLRSPLKELLTGPVRRLRAGPSGVELEYWDAEATKAREALVRAGKPIEPDDARSSSALLLSEELKNLAVASPEAAVAQAFSRVHAELQLLLTDAGESDAGGLDTHALVELAREKKLVDRQTHRSIEGLIVLHALGKSPFAGLTPERAGEYLSLADGVIYALRGKRAG